MAATTPMRIAPKTATTKAAISATGAVHAGHRGCGDSPSGSSGSSGGGPGGGSATGGGGGRLVMPGSNLRAEGGELAKRPNRPHGVVEHRRLAAAHDQHRGGTG